MCGIFGVVCQHDQRVDADFARSVIERLFRLSETRGKEAAGMALHDGAAIHVLKQACAASLFVKSGAYVDLIERSLSRWTSATDGRAFAMIGHSRLVTNGTQSTDANNQPVASAGVVAIHNGIIVNDAELWRRHPELERQAEVDTEIVANLMRSHLDRTGSAAEGTRLAFGELSGSASIAAFLDDVDGLVLATNTGSLFFLSNEKRGFLAFASERYILQRLQKSKGFREVVGDCLIQQVRAGEGELVGLHGLELSTFGLDGVAAPASRTSKKTAQKLPIVDHTSNRRKNLRRCKRCILPETYPFMDFDSDGVCRYCRGWRKIEPKGEEALLRAVEPYRSKDGSPDCILAFSGGRDSSYGLHYVKKRLGMNPVAFTYDWGMVTDLARRNQARICGSLGVEHILRSADIPTKRRYVRKNVEAWLKKPELGMVTLFTAGDKQFYSHARALRKETGIKLVVFCTGNMIEDTPYKTGLCGIREDDHGMTLTGLSPRNKVALLGYYMKQYLRNPRYFNESLLDTLDAFWATFVVKDDFLYLFHYLRWTEEEVVGTIRREYDWEVAEDTTSTWRIGDGTAPFYNYIYETMAGFSEDEVMLSNMIREGMIDRERAIEKAREYGKPRWPSIREYAQLAGFNCEEALSIINGAPKLY